MKIGLYDMQSGFTYIVKEEKVFFIGITGPCEATIFKTEDIIEKSDKEILEMYLDSKTKCHYYDRIQVGQVVSQRTIEFKL